MSLLLGEGAAIAAAPSLPRGAAQIVPFPTRPNAVCEADCPYCIGPETD